LIVEDYLQELVDFKVDTVILGCTHYPLIRSIIHELLPSVEIIEAGREAVFELQQVLQKENIETNKNGIGNKLYYVSEMTDCFKPVCESFIEEAIEGKVRTIKFD